MEDMLQQEIVLKREPLNLPLVFPFIFFIMHGYLHHANAEYSGFHNMRYQVYVMPDIIPALYAIRYW